MIPRKQLTAKVIASIQNNPVTALLGPRQCGKTTLSRLIAKDFDTVFFDLEDPVSAAQLTAAPKIILESLKGLVILDEIQRLPELFPVLRVLSDRPGSTTKFLILESASPGLIKSSSETLSGRIGFIDMSGFTLDEIRNDKFNTLWYRGGFPKSFLAKDDRLSFDWRKDFVRTFLERDIPALGIKIPSEALRRFWTMLAHLHGRVWNGSDFARSLSVSEPTAKRYLDILSGAYVVRQLYPWYENIGKRQVKSPKVYIRDSGILHFLLTLEGNNILSHPKLGLSWEGFVIEQIISISATDNYYFWATHAGAELDLLLFKNNRKTGVEIKFSDAPKITKSMRSAIESLNLDELFIVYPGRQSYKIYEKITVVSIDDVVSFFG